MAATLISGRSPAPGTTSKRLCSGGLPDSHKICGPIRLHHLAPRIPFRFPRQGQSKLQLCTPAVPFDVCASALRGCVERAQNTTRLFERPPRAAARHRVVGDSGTDRPPASRGQVAVPARAACDQRSISSALFAAREQGFGTCAQEGVKAQRKRQGVAFVLRVLRVWGGR